MLEGEGSMDALDLLEQQHLDICRLIDRITVEPSPGRRTVMINELARTIEAHMRIEETYLYPACAERMRGDRGKLHEAHETHALTRFAADSLLRTRVTDVCFEARLKLLRGLFEQHAADEEDWMFQKMKRDLSDEQLDDLGEHLARAYDLLLHIDTSAPLRAPVGRGRRTARRGGTGTSSRSTEERPLASGAVTRARVSRVSRV
ncbi:hemerythrin domain-containing protein [Chondromyces apiculatus]|nr:hemerythrin domain-containing protein [Chondromyces apiculatus]